MILVATERGGGLGHIQRLLPLLKRLLERGTAVSAAVVNVRHALLIPEGCAVYASPRCSRTGAQPSRKVANYYDLLWHLDLHDKETLAAEVRAWECLLAQIRPRLVIGDYTPVLALTCAFLDIPLIHVGTGYFNPPVGKPLIPVLADVQADSRNLEAQLLTALEPYLSRAHLPLDVTQIYGKAKVYATCLPDLDPYQALRTADGPMLGLPAAYNGETCKFFAYLNGSAKNAYAMFKLLTSAKVRCDLFLRDKTDAWDMLVDGTNVKLLDKPLALAQSLGQYKLIVHNGGLATSEIALALGVPQFIMPTHPEQTYNMEQIIRLGAGVNATNNIPLLLEELACGKLRAAAGEAAKRLRRPNAAIDLIMADIAASA